MPIITKEPRRTNDYPFTWNRSMADKTSSTVTDATIATRIKELIRVLNVECEAAARQGIKVSIKCDEYGELGCPVGYPALFVVISRIL